MKKYILLLLITLISSTYKSCACPCSPSSHDDRPFFEQYDSYIDNEETEENEDTKNNAEIIS